MSSTKVETNLGKMPTWMPRSGSVGAPVSPELKTPKTLGEVPPIIVNLADFPDLFPLFAYYGSLEKIRRKLKLLSGKDAKKLVLAKNTVGAADPQGLVYLGVEFLREHRQDDALLAAVMAHEWGHLISENGKHDNLDHLSWEEIFALRREEEASADVFCGRMLAMMGYSPEAITRFLIKAEKGSPTVKYYAANIRGAIIEEAHRRQSARGSVTRKIFPASNYANPYTSRLISTE